MRTRAGVHVYTCSIIAARYHFTIVHTILSKVSLQYMNIQYRARFHFTIVHTILSKVSLQYMNIHYCCKVSLHYCTYNIATRFHISHFAYTCTCTYKVYRFLRDSKLGDVVEDLLADKDDSQLDGELQQTAVRGALVQSQTSHTLKPTRKSGDTGSGGQSHMTCCTCTPCKYWMNCTYMYMM